MSRNTKSTRPCAAQSAKVAPYALAYAHIKLSRESLPAQLSKTVDP